MAVKKRIRKSCARCKKVKDLDAFCKGKAQHGRTSWCKECVAEKKRQDRRDPAKRERLIEQGRKERTRESYKSWRREDVLSGRSAERSRKHARRYYEENREKILARQKIARANPERRHKQKCNLLIGLMVYFGMLEKESCWCGNEDVEAAHRSYDDPLDIFWACSMHHRQYDHGLIREDGSLVNGDTGSPF